MVKTVPKILLPVLIVTFVAGWLFGRVSGPGGPVPPPTEPDVGASVAIDRVLPGEFESHDALLFSYIDEGPACELMANVIAAVHTEIDAVILVPDSSAQGRIEQLLKERDAPLSDVTFINFRTDNVWARDFGPLVVRSRSGRPEFVNTHYGAKDYPGKDFADRAPELLSRELQIPMVTAPLVMENGNILSNGAGVCVTTRKIVATNQLYGYSEADVARKFRSYFGAGQVMFLDAIEGEPTGHVDMFATFTGPNSIVVGQLPDNLTGGNAKVLDRNAARLSDVETAFGRMDVHRIPMPVPVGDSWFSYTNVVYANGILLVPHYDVVAAGVEDEVLAVYRQLLPDWKIVSFDCSQFIEHAGALHCTIMTLNRLPRRRKPLNADAVE